MYSLAAAKTATLLLALLCRFPGCLRYMLGDLVLGCVYRRGAEGGGGGGGGEGRGQVGALMAPPWRLRLPSTRATTCCGMATLSPAPVATP